MRIGASKADSVAMPPEATSAVVMLRTWTVTVDDMMGRWWL